MQLTIRPTYEMVQAESQVARTWIGATEDGLEVRVYVLRIEPMGGTAEQRARLAAGLIRSASHPPPPAMPGPARPGAPAAPASRPRAGVED